MGRLSVSWCWEATAGEGQGRTAGSARWEFACFCAWMHVCCSSSACLLTGTKFLLWAAMAAWCRCHAPILSVELMIRACYCSQAVPHLLLLWLRAAAGVLRARWLDTVARPAGRVIGPGIKGTVRRWQLQQLQALPSPAPRVCCWGFTRSAAVVWLICVAGVLLL